MLVLWIADQVEVHVFDDGHASWAVGGAQTGQIVAEDEVETGGRSLFAGCGQDRRFERVASAVKRRSESRPSYAAPGREKAFQAA